MQTGATYEVRCICRDIHILWREEKEMSDFILLFLIIIILILYFGVARGYENTCNHQPFPWSR